MLAKKEVARIYETILSIPGMTEEVKFSLKISRKNLLLLNKVIEKGLNVKDTDDTSISVLEIVSRETLQELSEISRELLDRAGLAEMNEKLKTF